LRREDARRATPLLRIQSERLPHPLDIQLDDPPSALRCHDRARSTRHAMRKLGATTRTGLQDFELSFQNFEDTAFQDFELNYMLAFMFHLDDHGTVDGNLDGDSVYWTHKSIAGDGLSACGIACRYFSSNLRAGRKRSESREVTGTAFAHINASLL
jgi:hypothetical protein